MKKIFGNFYKSKCCEIKYTFFYSASVTAIFEFVNGTEKSFMRTVQGSSADHYIDGNVRHFTIFM